MVDNSAHKSNVLQESAGESLPARSHRPCLNSLGFTLVELLVCVVILGVLATMVVPAFSSLVNNAKISRCKSELRNLEKDVIAYFIDRGVMPNDLTVINRGTLRDPWGHLYQYANFANGDPPRLNQFLLNLNSEFDLFSVGKDGLSQQNITDANSLDDIVRAGDGGWVGLAENY
jgi:general secretion pathway protein G